MAIVILQEIKRNEVHATLTSYTVLETNQNYNSYKEW